MDFLFFIHQKKQALLSALIPTQETNYSNSNLVDEWLMKNSTQLLSTKNVVPLDNLKTINYELYNAKVTKPAFLFAEFTLNNIKNQILIATKSGYLPYKGNEKSVL